MVGQENDENTRHPALRKFSETWEYVKHVAKTTLLTGLKGAVIGGLAMAAAAAPFALVAGGGEMVPLVGGLVTKLGWGAQNWLIAGGLAGAQIGMVAGGALGLAQGFGGAEDAVEEAQQSLISKYQRAKQRSAYDQMLATGLQRFSAPMQNMPAMGAQPQFNPGLPNMNMGKNQGIGQG